MKKILFIGRKYYIFHQNIEYISVSKLYLNAFLITKLNWIVYMIKFDQFMYF